MAGRVATNPDTQVDDGVATSHPWWHKTSPTTRPAARLQSGQNSSTGSNTVHGIPTLAHHVPDQPLSHERDVDRNPGNDDTGGHEQR